MGVVGVVHMLDECYTRVSGLNTHPHTERKQPTMNHLPFFVYGTLRVGFGNHGCFPNGSITNVQPATLDGATMTTIGFPYVWRTPTGEVTGELMTVDPALYDQTVQSLDGLEGYSGPGANNHYDRTIVDVTLPTGEVVKAYTYLVDEARGGGYTPVPSGDFADTRKPGFVYVDPFARFDETTDLEGVSFELGDDVTWTSPESGEYKPGVLIDLIGDQYLMAFYDGTYEEVAPKDLSTDSLV